MRNLIINKYRSEYGKRHRKQYENGCRDFGGRRAMVCYSSRPDDKCGTIMLAVQDNLILEMYEKPNQAIPSRL